MAHDDPLPRLLVIDDDNFITDLVVDVANDFKQNQNGGPRLASEDVSFGGRHSDDPTYLVISPTHRAATEALGIHRR